MSLKLAVYWQYFSTFSQGILQLLSIIIFSRVLSVEDFGLLTIISFFTNFTLIISQLGFGASIIQAENIHVKQIQVSHTISQILGVVFTLILIFSASNIAIYFDVPKLENLLKISSISFLISSAYTIKESYLTRLLDFKLLSITNSFSYLIGSFFVSLILLYFNYGVYSIVIGNVIFHLIKFLVYAFKFNLGFSFQIKELKSLLGFSFGFSVTRVLNFMSTNIDNLLISKYMGVYSAGIYSRSFNIVQVPIQFLVSSIEKVLFPYLSSIKNNNSELRSRYLTVLEISNNIMVPISVVFLLYSQEIIYLLLGPNWQDSIIPLQLLGMTIFLRNSTKVNDSLIKSLGMINERILKEFIYLILVVISIYAGKDYGINYICFFLLTITLVNFLLTIVPIKKSISVSYINLFKTFKQGINVSFVLIFVFSIIKSSHILSSNLYLNIAIITVINLVVLLLLFILFRNTDIFISKKIHSVVLKRNKI